jgi:hypothetical protein
MRAMPRARAARFIVPVSPLGQDAPLAWPKSLVIFKRALQNALTDFGVRMWPFADNLEVPVVVPFCFVDVERWPLLAGGERSPQVRQSRVAMLGFKAQDVEPPSPSARLANKP